MERSIEQFQKLVEENPDQKLTLELEVDRGSLLTRIFKDQVPLLESFQSKDRELSVEYQDGILISISLREGDVKNVAIRTTDNKLRLLRRTVGNKEVLKMVFGDEGTHDLDKNLLPKEFHDVVVPGLIEHVDLISPRKETRKEVTEKEETEKENMTEKEVATELEDLIPAQPGSTS